MTTPLLVRPNKIAIDLKTGSSDPYDGYVMLRLSPREIDLLRVAVAAHYEVGGPGQYPPPHIAKAYGSLELCGLASVLFQAQCGLHAEDA